MLSRLLFGLLALAGAASAALLASTPPSEFDTALIRLEQNVSDGDGELVIEAQASEDGLKRVSLFNPSNKKIYSTTAKAKTLGTRELTIESPEPALADVLDAYPVGTYTLKAVGRDGTKYEAEIELSHDLPGTPVITAPVDDSTGVSPGSLVITWNAVPGAVAYFLELEQEDLEVAVTADLPGSATSFTPPDGWVLSDSPYQVGVGAINAVGNRTFTEIQFTTGT